MSEEFRALAFVGSRLLLLNEGGTTRLPRVSDLEAALGPARLGEASVDVRLPQGSVPCLCYGFDALDPEPQGYELVGLRAAYHHLEEAEFRTAGAARQKVEWHRSTRFCCACGASAAPSSDHEAMQCTECDRLHFPPLSPAVIVLVQRGREALLARSPRFSEGVYSTLAGFVEPGESIEECVHREIFEEVGVRVCNLRYFGSQPHPFPHSLMIGFVVDWAEGEITIDETEIEDARWFTPDDLPVLPHPMSIARALIEDFVARVG